ncbi:MAG: FKBP-type peptidyl-prolyl cis-trans isomerase [Bacteroidetes bacterium]|nr:FKBP-type peptidyl-prolyl cis-trans isomerase [Bacteroidota bacterium]
MVWFNACKDDTVSVSPEEQMRIDQEKIETYLSEHQLTSVKTESGLHHVILTEGPGDHPSSTSEVEVKYVGKLVNDQIFDQTQGNKSITFGLDQVIDGWREGIPLMKTGGKSLLLIPSQLGYGSRDLRGIPANSVLVFEVELINFK